MKIVGYIAASLDSYIATPDGGIGWLDPFNEVDAGYPEFIAGIGTVVLGRRTYDQVLGFPGAWSYAGKRSIVVTSRPLGDDAPAGAEAWHAGVPALVEHLRGQEGEPAWVIGGAAIQTEFIERGAFDHLDLFVIPVLLGDGIPLFPKSALRRGVTLASTASLGKGMVRLSYSFD